MFITKEKALELLRKHIKRENLIKHCIATGMIMRALAKRLGEDEDLWEVVGILHDLDVDETSPEEHTRVTEEILRDLGAPEEVVHAIVSHNDLRGIPRETRLDHALAAAENVSGLIVAAALVLPEKSIEKLALKSLKKRFKEKRFASGANRNAIKECEKLGISLDEFLELSLEAMRKFQL